MSILLSQMPGLSPFYNLAEDNKIQRELVLTNQEGTLFYATCYDYFVDLAVIEHEFYEKGYLNKYLNKEIVDKKITLDDLNEIADIAATKIPKGKYFLPFTMCLISLKSYKYQFFRILDTLYRNYT